MVTGVTESNIVTRALFEGLVTKTLTHSKPEPGVAQRWDVSDDGLTITFHLNPAAKWSNGDPTTAQDFVWSRRRALTRRWATSTRTCSPGGKRRGLRHRQTG
ncbi:MAG: hypothetical protein IPG64_20245 [Haliea sp.]|nr:hypothetical protein [Haliea sp.]